MRKMRKAEETSQLLAASVPYWAARWEPYARALARLKLPPRGPVGSEANVRRAVLVQQCMMEVKRSLSKKANKQRSV
jgi:hypothetical protein